MATNDESPMEEGMSTEQTTRAEDSRNGISDGSDACGGLDTSDPIAAAEELLRLANDTSLSPRQRFFQVDQAANRLLRSFPEPRNKPTEEEPVAEIGDEAYEATSEASAREYIESLAVQASDIIEMGLDKIAEGLRVPVQVLPKKAIRQAQKHRELMVPRLIHILEESAAFATKEKPFKDNAHFFTLFLLAEFEAPEAFPAIRKILSLPEGLPYDLFGDAVCEDVPKILSPFTGNRPEVLEEMIADLSMDSSVRCGAATTITAFVRAGQIPWEEGVRILGRELIRDALENNAAIFDLLSSILTEIFPSRLVGKIENALFSDEPVETEPTETESVMKIIEEAIADPKTRRGCVPIDPEPLPKVDDTLDELQGWCCFREDEKEEEDEEEIERIKALSGQEIARLRGTLPPPAPHFLEEREETALVVQPIVSDRPRIGRNAPCPCGSGKKYKKCCGANK